MARRVVVTGIGLVTPIAVGTEETWQGLLAGKSGIGPITHFDHTAFATHFAGEVKDFDPLRWMTAREAKTLDPFVRYAVAAGSFAGACTHFDTHGIFEVSQRSRYLLAISVTSVRRSSRSVIGLRPSSSRWRRRSVRWCASQGRLLAV